MPKPGKLSYIGGDPYERKCRKKEQKEKVFYNWNLNGHPKKMQ